MSDQIVNGIGLDWAVDRVTRSFEHEERNEAQAQR